MGKQTILIIEDDKKIVELIKAAIKKINTAYDVEVAYNGQEALKIISQKNIDIALLDILMPVMSGAQLLVELRKQKIWFPILIITGYSVADIHHRLQEFGIIDIMAKPLDILVLKQKIEEILKKRKQKDSIFGMSLSTIMQVLEIEKRTGIMTIKLGEKTCRIFFRKGKVIDIEADGGTGEKALIQYLDDTVENKEINIEYLPHKRKENIFQTFTELILNISKIKDEERKKKNKNMGI